MNESHKYEYYWYWLCNIPGIGNRKIRQLLRAFETPYNVYMSSAEALEMLTFLSNSDVSAILESKLNCEIYKEYITNNKRRIQFISCENEKYPQRLKNVYDYPVGLYLKGRLPLENVPSVAIVGARKCTSYGKQIAYAFAKKFAQMGVQVISGMALGVDSAAHKGCIDGGGYTCAVLGCGVDVCYPAINIELYNYIEETGGIISEYSIGMPPHSGQFPMRNRIISGLADVVIIVEAGQKSGSLITVDQALEQNRDIMVVPGRIGDELSKGCNNLIKLGAQIILEPEDILENNIIKNLLNRKMYSLNNDKTVENRAEVCEDKIQKNNENTKKQLASPKDMLYSCFDLYPKSIDTIAKEMKLDTAILNKLIAELLLEGSIDEVSKNCYVRTFI